ncbi:IclR family transcriptional regulator [Arenibacterium sp. LLYu02]|uniref:IclR family transcriptional regulator n=1 Tax=Arenibacterium sp. LLYu02 TaxID=3404132 RepID=UPI003B226554
MSEQKGVDAVDRALQILDCFSAATPELTLAEIAKATGLYKSTILRLAASLEKFGHVVRDEGGLFRLGPTTWRLGSTYRQSFDLSEILRPELKLLSKATGETASYYIREGNARVCLYRSEPQRSIRHSITEGVSMPLEHGASGKILRAYSKNEQEVAPEILEAGYAVSLGERDPEVAAVSVPICALDGRLLGALAVSGLITRFSEDRLPELTAALRETQQRLSDKISS